MEPTGDLQGPAAFFWKLPPNGDQELGDPGEETHLVGGCKITGSTGTMAAAQPPTVQWPPIATMPLAPVPEVQRGVVTAASANDTIVAARGTAALGRTGGNARGRGRRKGAGAGGKGDMDRSEGFSASERALPHSAQKREDGWLPKAEYEAKKREERARRQRERDQERGQGAATLAAIGGNCNSGGPQASGPGGDTRSGARGRGRSGRGWEDLPKRPDPPEETPESRALREAEEMRMHSRDRLRSAVTIEEMRAAIAAARELGLTEEVRMGERKLAKMES